MSRVITSWPVAQQQQQQLFLAHLVDRDAGELGDGDVEDHAADAAHHHGQENGSPPVVQHLQRKINSIGFDRKTSKFDVWVGERF